MARAKKDGKFLNCYIDRAVFDRLEEYCQKTAFPKTTVLEKALKKYLSEFDTDEEDKSLKKDF